jgi:hypothetical protein
MQGSIIPVRAALAFFYRGTFATLAEFPLTELDTAVVKDAT